MKKRSKAIVLTSLLLGGVTLSTVSCGETVDTEATKETYVILDPIITPKEGGSFSIDPALKTGDVGKEVPFIVKTNKGYILKEIKINSEVISLETRKFSPKQGDNTIEVTFEKDPSVPDTPVVEKKGTVKVLDTTGGTVSASINEGKVGSEVTLTITPDDTHEIDTVKVNDTLITPVEDVYKFNLVEGENKVSVTFKEKVVEPTTKKGTVTINELVGGTITSSILEGEVGSEVILTVTPDDTHEINVVKVNDTLITPVEGVYKFNLVEGENIVSAEFKEKTPEQVTKKGTVTITKSTDGDVTASKTEGDVDEEITLTINPHNGKVIDEVIVNDTILEPVEEVYKFKLIEGENIVTVTFKDDVTPIESKVLFIKGAKWFHEAEAKVAIMAYDSKGNALTSGEFGELASDNGFDEINDVKYWTYKTPANTAKIKIFRVSKDSTPDHIVSWNASTKLIDLSTLKDNNLIILPEEKASGTDIDVMFGKFDPNTPLPSYPSLGEYTLNVTFESKWTNEIKKENTKLYYHIYNTFDPKDTTSWPGEEVSLDTNGKFVLKVALKANSVFLFHVSNGSNVIFQTEDTTYDYASIESKSMDILVKDDLEVSIKETSKPVVYPDASTFSYLFKPSAEMNLKDAYIYLFGDNKEENAAYPGEKMSLTSTEGVYGYNLSIEDTNAYTHVIFNAGKDGDTILAKTIDLSLTEKVEGYNVFEVNKKDENGTYVGNWTNLKGETKPVDPTPDPDPQPTLPDASTFSYLFKPSAGMKLEKAYIYLYGDTTKNAEYPGEEMTLTSTEGVYGYNLKADDKNVYTNVIFNAGNNKAQTTEISLKVKTDEYKVFVAKDTLDTESHFMGDWTNLKGETKPVEPTPDPVTKTKITVSAPDYWDNYEAFTRVYVYTDETEKCTYFDITFTEDKTSRFEFEIEIPDNAKYIKLERMKDNGNGTFEYWGNTDRLDFAKAKKDGLDLLTINDSNGGSFSKKGAEVIPTPKPSETKVTFTVSYPNYWDEAEAFTRVYVYTDETENCTYYDFTFDKDGSARFEGTIEIPDNAKFIKLERMKDNGDGTFKYWGHTEKLEIASHIANGNNLITIADNDNKVTITKR